MAQHENSPAHLKKGTDRHEIVLRDFARVAADATDLHWLLEQAARQAARATAVTHAKVMRYRPQHGDLLVVAGVGWKEGVVGPTRLGIDMASPPGRCFQTRRPVIVDDIRDNREFRYAPILQEHGIVSILHAPVTIDSEVWGVIEVDSENPRSFDEHDERFF
ncbi:MAG TPA: GAF domain-containing protein, partial [Azospirillaceae bacterium]|nr:GAF domain-containing protein [Azospirillaceae bacterium]